MAVKSKVCLECEAEFKVKFDMDSTRYVVQYCPFCGAEISEDDEDPPRPFFPSQEDIDS